MNRAVPMRDRMCVCIPIRHCILHVPLSSFVSRRRFIRFTCRLFSSVFFTPQQQLTMKYGAIHFTARFTGIEFAKTTNTTHCKSAALHTATPPNPNTMFSVRFLAVSHRLLHVQNTFNGASHRFIKPAKRLTAPFAVLSPFAAFPCCCRLVSIVVLASPRL